MNISRTITTATTIFAVTSMLLIAPPAHAKHNLTIVDQLRAGETLTKKQLNHTNKRKQTALHRVAHHNLIDDAAFLIEAGININKKDKWGQTALHYAVYRQHIEIINLLLDAGAKTNIRDSESRLTPLGIAKAFRLTKAEKALMEAGVTK